MCYYLFSTATIINNFEYPGDEKPSSKSTTPWGYKPKPVTPKPNKSTSTKSESESNPEEPWDLPKTEDDTDESMPSPKKPWQYKPKPWKFQKPWEITPKPVMPKPKTTTEKPATETPKPATRKPWGYKPTPKPVTKKPKSKPVTTKSPKPKTKYTPKPLHKKTPAYDFEVPGFGKRTITKTSSSASSKAEAKGYQTKRYGYKPRSENSEDEQPGSDTTTPGKWSTGYVVSTTKQPQYDVTGKL